MHHSDYTMVPPEWLGPTFIRRANELKERNPRAYEHTYLGVATGEGGAVFKTLRVKPISAADRARFELKPSIGMDFGYWMLFSNVGDLTALKAQLSAVISKANGLSDTLTATIDARLAALTEAGGTDLAEVVDARMGAASLRERMSSIRAMWMHSFFETTGRFTPCPSTTRRWPTSARAGMTRWA